MDKSSAPMLFTPATWVWMASQMENQISARSVPDAQPKPATTNRNPLESEATLSDDDFPPKKQSMATLESNKRGRPKAQLKQLRKSSAQSSTSAAASVNALKVLKYPKPFDKSLLKIAYAQEDECPACQTYVGSVIIKPCGHAKFCMNCINNLRTQACKNRRPAMCPDRDCYSLVTSWIVMKNIHLK